jgi:F0F1-type ATP synthase alpha subunit
MMKEAGRRDFDVLIAQAAEELQQEKQAELQGAAHFDELLKQAALEEAVAENQTLAAKVAEYESFIKQAQEEYAHKTAAESFQQQQVKLAESVADIVLSKLRSEMVSTNAAE